VDTPKNKPQLLVSSITNTRKYKHQRRHTEPSINLSHSPFPMSNVSGDEGSFSSGNNGEEVLQETQHQQPQNQLHDSTSGPSAACNTNASTNQQTKKKRNLPGTPGKYTQLQFSFFFSFSDCNCRLTNQVFMFDEFIFCFHSNV